MDRLGRLARSLEVFPILLTQKVSDALDAGLAGYISRGLIMHISDVAEARASFQLFKLDADPGADDPGDSETEDGRRDTDDDTPRCTGGGVRLAQSLKALADCDRRVHRGARSATTSTWPDAACRPRSSIPDWFIRIASTNGLDIRARDQAHGGGRAGPIHTGRRRGTPDHSASAPGRAGESGRAPHTWQRMSVAACR